MQPIEIAKGIYDVGVKDWNIRDFHGYSTYQGTTYNAFLIVDEKVALIDTVKKEFADQMLDNIARIIDPKKIDLVISNHTEMDHSGGLPRVMHRIGEDKPLYCSQMGARNLKQHFFPNWNYQPVKNGEELSLGSRTLTFLETRMLHWPDSMFTYLKEDKILFSSDGFGQHYAGFEKFDDQADADLRCRLRLRHGSGDGPDLFLGGLDQTAHAAGSVEDKNHLHFRSVGAQHSAGTQIASDGIRRRRVGGARLPVRRVEGHAGSGEAQQGQCNEFRIHGDTSRGLTNR